MSETVHIDIGSVEDPRCSSRITDPKSAKKTREKRFVVLPFCSQKYLKNEIDFISGKEKI
jgi:hypothetical protein